MRTLRVLPPGAPGRGAAVTTGRLLEVFRSFQGEGPFAGARQAFVRLAGCHLRCSYCDTPESWEATASWRVERTPGARDFEFRDNPVEPAAVLDILRDWAGRERLHSVSFTGGEPVLQAEFLRELAAGTRALGLRTYLDTSGTLADRLAIVAPEIDIFAFDVKLPSCPGVRMDWDDTARALALARGREAFAKIVVMDDSDPAEVRRAARLVRQADPSFLVVLQPVTPVSEATRPPSGSAIAAFRRACLEEGADPVVLPQLHKLAGWL